MSTLGDQARRVVMGSFPGPAPPAWMWQQVHAGLGSLCVFGSNVAGPDQLAAVTAALHTAQPDLLVAVDEEGGDVTRLHAGGGSPYPGNAALGAVDDEALTRGVARVMGSALATAGIDLDLAPVVDVATPRGSTATGVRAFGSDADLVARHTAAFVVGLQSAGVGACVKHFPGHGDTVVDSHLGRPVVDVPLSTLLTRDLVPFAAGIGAGAVAVMSGHLTVPAVDPKAPATFSKPVVSLLRDRLDFSELLVSDALDMRGAGDGTPAAAVRALAAGCDLVCLGPDKDGGLHEAVVRAVVRAVETGALPEQRLVEAGGRVLAAAERVRELRASAVVAGGGHEPAEAARRALQVEGTLPDVRGATVLRLRTGTTLAAGPVPWGLPPDGAVLAGRAMVDVVEASAAADLRAVAAGRPVVALVREAHRSPWALEALQSLARARPDVVVVDMGWPVATDLPGAAVVRTFGASAVTGRALDELLARPR